MTPEEFDNRVENAVIQALTKFADELLFKKLVPEKKGLVKIKELMDTFQVTKQTIFNWSKRGLINPRKIGNRTLYDLDEIYKAINFYPSRFGNGDKYKDMIKNKQGNF